MRKHLAVAGSTFLTLTAVMVHSCFTSVQVERQSFDSASWKKLHDAALLNDPGCVRGGMALDLLKSKVLLGLRSEQVFAVLGRSETSEPELRFPLGQCHWDWKHSDLVVEFGPQRKVTSTEIRVVE